MILQASIYIVFASLLIVSALLLLVVLMQRPKQEGLGAAFGAQMTDQAFGAQTTDVLKKGTVFFGTLFMLLSFVLAVLMNAQYKQSRTNISQDAAAVETKAPQPTEQKLPLRLQRPRQRRHPLPHRRRGAEGTRQRKEKSTKDAEHPRHG